ncbi:MAG: tetratricopeptide repeat protein [Candidatus Omnitrophica bacterium]|nr:tetratricopeptide repeat protein [Candidatus Omnitrophota bacterium]
MKKLWAEILLLCLAPFLCGFKFVSEIQNERGNSLYKKGRVAKAGAAYEGALKSDPDSQGAALNRGNAYYKEGKMDRALETYKKAAKPGKNPALQSAAFYNLGNTLFRRGDLGRAEEFYKQALRLNPKDQDAKYNLERLLKQKNQENQNKNKENQNKNQDQKNQNQKQSGGQGGESKPENQPAAGAEPDQEKKAEEKESRQKSAAAEQQAGEESSTKENQDKGEGEGQKPEEKKPEEKKSEAQIRAEQILNALENQEKQALKLKGGQKNNRVQYRRTNEEDW